MAIRCVLHDAHARISRHEPWHQFGQGQLGERDRTGESDGAARFGGATPHDAFRRLGFNQHGQRVAMELRAYFRHDEFP